MGEYHEFFHPFTNSIYFPPSSLLKSLKSVLSHFSFWVLTPFYTFLFISRPTPFLSQYTTFPKISFASKFFSSPQQTNIINLKYVSIFEISLFRIIQSCMHIFTSIDCKFQPSTIPSSSSSVAHARVNAS